MKTKLRKLGILLVIILIVLSMFSSSSYASNQLVILKIINGYYDKDSSNYCIDAMDGYGGVYTIPVSGYYRFSIGQRWASNATGIRYVTTVITGASSALGTTYNVFNTNTDFVNNSASDTLYFNAGDTIAVQGFQNSGGALAFKAGTAYFEIERLSGEKRPYF